MPTVPISSSAGGSGGGSVTLITSSVLGAPAANIDFSGIVNTYSTLQAVCYWRGDTAATSATVLLTANADGAANYHVQRVSGSAASAGAAESLNATAAQVGLMPANTATASYFGMCNVFIPQYAATVGFKPILSTEGFVVGAASGNGEVDCFFNHWRNTAAITRLTFTPSAGNFVAGTAVFLYGLS